jgi:hypothetical protein
VSCFKRHLNNGMKFCSVANIQLDVFFMLMYSCLMKKCSSCIHDTLNLLFIWSSDKYAHARFLAEWSRDSLVLLGSLFTFSDHTGCAKYAVRQLKIFPKLLIMDLWKNGVKVDSSTMVVHHAAAWLDAGPGSHSVTSWWHA